MVNERYASGSVGETCSIADQIIQNSQRNGGLYLKIRSNRGQHAIDLIKRFLTPYSFQCHMKEESFVFNFESLNFNSAGYWRSIMLFLPNILHCKT